MRNLLLIASLFWAMTAAAASAAAPADTGKAVGVQPSANAELQNVSRTLEVGSDVSIGDTVSTGDTGEVQMLFTEDTKLLVGPKSSLLIEAYLLRPDKNTARQVTIDALAGTFRFITGKSAKNAYRIDTPNGTIGVRGTKFDIHVSDTGTTVVLFEGQVRMCNLDDKCVTISAACGVGMTTPAGATTVGRAQQTALRPFFPYVQSDSALLPDFRVVNAGDCLKPVPPPPPATRTPPRRVTVQPPRGPTVNVAPPTRVRPPRGTRPPPVRVIDPCADFDLLSRAEQLALIRNHICAAPPRQVQIPDLPPPSLATPPGGRLPPRRYPPRGSNSDGASGSSGSGTFY